MPLPHPFALLNVAEIALQCALIEPSKFDNIHQQINRKITHQINSTSTVKQSPIIDANIFPIIPSIKPLKVDTNAQLGA